MKVFLTDLLGKPFYSPRKKNRAIETWGKGKKTKRDPKMLSEYPEAKKYQSFDPRPVKNLVQKAWYKSC